ncbi:hypothetical protein FA09DRAFT_146809 [Tilletiopsis washingtonensis]|uniref:Uncharacterized protein n=1 Tax=Tilletiopsis washingtonensis TaxID=58919 RepID=A0A316Z2W8_9BASI|nr:hypothetical protein FA09DRAFT_146809 [Tilletiopsis washingtonensis]PWN95308.1 hypothetical protein FA09DRAFT_146809 [Tilletiopsis washingtonensis]
MSRVGAGEYTKIIRSRVEVSAAADADEEDTSFRARRCGHSSHLIVRHRRPGATSNHGQADRWSCSVICRQALTASRATGPASASSVDRPRAWYRRVGQVVSSAEQVAHASSLRPLRPSTSRNVASWRLMMISSRRALPGCSSNLDDQLRSACEVEAVIVSHIASSLLPTTSKPSCLKHHRCRTSSSGRAIKAQARRDLMVCPLGLLVVDRDIAEDLSVTSCALPCSGRRRARCDAVPAPHVIVEAGHRGARLPRLGALPTLRLSASPDIDTRGTDERIFFGAVARPVANDRTRATSSMMTLSPCARLCLPSESATGRSAALSTTSAPHAIVKSEHRGA